MLRGKVNGASVGGYDKSVFSEIPTLSLPKGRDPYRNRIIGSSDHRVIGNAKTRSNRSAFLNRPTNDTRHGTRTDRPMTRSTDLPILPVLWIHLPLGGNGISRKGCTRHNLRLFYTPLQCRGKTSYP